MRSCITLAVAFVAAAALSSAAFGGVWTAGNGATLTPNYGSDAWGYMGLNGAQTYELFRKENFNYSGASYSTAANVTGNGTLMTLDQQWLNATLGAGGKSYAFTGATMLGTSAATATSVTSPFILSTMTNSLGSEDGFDLRVGFMNNPSLFTAAGYNTSDYDPGDFFATDGVDMHLNVKNVGSEGWTTQAPLEANLVAQNSTLAEHGGRNNLSPGSITVQTVAGNAPVQDGTGAYVLGTTGNLDISMNIASTGTNSAVFTVKLGSQLFSMPVNLANPGNSDGVGYGEAGGKLNLSQLTPFIYIGDMNYNGTAQPAVAKFGIGLPGDANGDGAVNIGDLTTIASHWQMTNATYADGDVNGDGTVNIGDVTFLASHWQQTANGETFQQALASFPQLAAAAAPEPSTLVLLVLGALGLATRLFFKARKLNPFNLLGVHRMKKIVALFACVAMLGATAAYGIVVNPSDIQVTFTAESSPVTGYTGYLVSVTATDTNLVQGFDFATAGAGTSPNTTGNLGFFGTFGQDWNPGRSGATPTPLATSYTAGIAAYTALDSFMIYPSDSVVITAAAEGTTLGPAFPGYPSSDSLDAYGTSTSETGAWALQSAEAAKTVNVAYLVVPTGQLPKFDGMVTFSPGLAGQTYEVYSTPEPTTLVLLVTGIALMLGRVIIRRRHA